MEFKKISKTKIRDLGEKIRENQYLLSNDLLNELEEYRLSYKKTISDTYNILNKISLSIYQNSITTYRIKRIESIISKLIRFRSMKLDRMWDIAGCRCILNSNKKLYQLKEEIVKNFKILKINDYIETPQSDGYKSLHIYVKSPNDENIVEIQLRNKENHNWATLVEITDLLFDEKLKEKKSNSELHKLHLLFSNRDNNKINEKRKIIHIIKKQKFLEKLSEVFSRNYISVRKKWINLEDLKGYSYILIEAAKDTIPQIDIFSSFDEAEDQYFKRFKINSNANRVLTHLPHPTYKKISIAYSNYILTYHQFIDDCFNMLETLIIDSIKKNNLLNFNKYYAFYLYINAFHLENIDKEMQEYTNSNVNSNRKYKEWFKDITEELKKRQKKINELIDQMNRQSSNNVLFQILFRLIFIRANNYYKKYMKKNKSYKILNVR